MRRKQGDASNAVLRELRAFGLGYPGAHSKSPWPGGAYDNACARRRGDRVGTHARRMLRCMSSLRGFRILDPQETSQRNTDLTELSSELLSKGPLTFWGDRHSARSIDAPNPPLLEAVAAYGRPDCPR